MVPSSARANLRSSRQATSDAPEGFEQLGSDDQATTLVGVDRHEILYGPSVGDGHVESTVVVLTTESPRAGRC